MIAMCVCVYVCLHAGGAGVLIYVSLSAGIYTVDLIDDCLYNWNIKLYR